MIVNFVLFCFATIGMTNIIVDSNIFEPIRNWFKDIAPEKIYDLITCHQCCGTWCGFLCGAILLTSNIWVILCCGCAGSFLASLNYLITELIISKTTFDLNIESPDVN